MCGEREIEQGVERENKRRLRDREREREKKKRERERERSLGYALSVPLYNITESFTSMFPCFITYDTMYMSRDGIAVRRERERERERDLSRE